MAFCRSTSDEGLSADQPIQVNVEARAHGWRVDHYLSRIFPNFSRGLFQKAIEQQAVLVNGIPVKASRRLRVNDLLSVRLPVLPDRTLPPEDIPLDVLYEDDALIVINKPAGLIVHPGKGNYRGTLAGALQFHFNRLSDVAGQLRPGIVHRLDRDTSGLLVVAKDNQVHHRLSGQFERREVEKEYLAVTRGVFELDSDEISTFVRVNPKKREKMVVSEPIGNARPAITHYEVATRYAGFTAVRLFPKTGRTHQLRVHMQYLRHPIVADRLYGGGACLTIREVIDGPDTTSQTATRKKRRATEECEADDVLIDRHALHARRLTFRHPQSGKRLEFEAPVPIDLHRTLEALDRHRSTRDR